MFKLAIALTLVAVAFGSKPDWDGLRIKYGVPHIDGGYTTMPRTVADAKKADFKLLDNQCEGSGNLFVGMRYWYKNDPSVILIFDVRGYIAGIQTGAPRGQYTPTTFNENTSYEDDIKHSLWTLTAYFTDPRIICTAGRSSDDYSKEGTGDALYLQNGTNPLTDVVEIPMKESDIKKTKWGSGKCFVGMGQHYWFNVSKDSNCDKDFPYCVLYTGGKLNAFCFAIDGDVSSSQNRYEHPTAAQAAQCCIDAPDCFKTSPRMAKGKQSTMHVFMTEYPYLSNNCL